MRRFPLVVPDVELRWNQILNGESFGIGIFVPKREGIASPHSAGSLTRRYRWRLMTALLRQLESTEFPAEQRRYLEGRSETM